MSKKDTIVKTVQKKEDFYVEFTDEEMECLGFERGDKFEVEVGDNQSIVLRKMAKIDLDLEDFDKSTLVFLIEESVREQKPVDDVIREVITKHLSELKSEATGQPDEAVEAVE